MANEQNLKPINSVEMAREYQKKSVEARNRNSAEKKNLRLALEMLLEKNFKDKNGKEMTGTQAITAKLFEQAMKGNVKAFETIRATVGQDPIQKIQVDKPTDETVQELEDLLLNDE